MIDKFSGEDEYVTQCIIDVSRRSFYLISNEGIVQEIACDEPSQFMDVLEIVTCVTDIDSEIQIIYADPIVSENAGVAH